MKRKALSSLGLIAALSLCSCNKDKAKPKDEANSDTPGASRAQTSGPTAASIPGPKLDKLSELWAFAPDDAAFGIVVEPGTGNRLLSMANNIIATVNAMPVGAKAIAEMNEELAEEKFNPFKPGAFAKAGFDLEKGAAIFFIGDKDALMIMPVSDGDAFQAFVKEMDDDEEDDDDDPICEMRDAFYVCAHNKERLASFAANPQNRLAQRAAKLDAGSRGHIEFLMDVAAFEAAGESFANDSDFNDNFTKPTTLFGSMRAGNGSVQARFWMDAKGKGPFAAAHSVPSTLTTAAKKDHPGGVFSLRLPVAEIAELTMKEDQPLPGGGSVKKDIVGNLTGEVLMHIPSSSESTWAVFGLGIKNPEPFKKLLGMGCTMAPAAGLPGLSSEYSNGACLVTLDFSKMPLPDPKIAEVFEKPLPIRAEALANEFRITIGTTGKINEKVALSALGQTLVDEKWNMVVWGQGTSLVGKDLNLADYSSAMAAVPPDELDNVKLALWLLGHLYETGFGVAMRDDGMHVLAQVGTYAADPDEAYQAYGKALRKAIDSGDLSGFDALSKKYPNTRAGSARDSSGGSLIAGAIAGIGAGAVGYLFMGRSKSEVIETSGEMPPQMAVPPMQPGAPAPAKVH